MGLVYELMGGTEAAQTQYREGLALLAGAVDLKQPLDDALTLLLRAGMEPPEVQAATYAQAVGSLDGLLPDNTRNICLWRAAIDAHLSLGLAELQTARRSAAADFASAAGLARQMVTRDPDDTQRRSDLAIALRRSALVPAMEGKIDESNRLRGEATAELRKSAFQVPAPATQVEQAVPACPSMDEQFSEGTSLTPLKAGDLLIANRSSASGAGTLLVFSPESHEMSVLATGGTYPTWPMWLSAPAPNSTWPAAASPAPQGSCACGTMHATDAGWKNQSPAGDSCTGRSGSRTATSISSWAIPTTTPRG
jgi:hypothetical protein